MATLTEDDFRALIEQAHQLRVLTERPEWTVFVDWLNYRMNPVKRGLLNGGVASHDDYLRQSSWLLGVTDAIDSAEHVAKLVANERERRDELADAAREDA